MKPFARVLLFIICPIFIHAQLQKKAFDRLHLLLKNAPNDTLRMDAYDSLAYFYIEANNDSAYFYSQNELLLAHQLSLKINEAAALKTEGYILSKEGNYTESLDKFTQALRLAANPESEKKIWNLDKGQTPREQRLQCLGWIFIDQTTLYRKNNQFDKAVISNREAIKITDSIHYTPIAAYGYDHLAHYCVLSGRVDSALFYTRKAAGYFLNADEIYKGDFINFLAQLYQKSGSLDSSAQAFRLAIAVNKKSNNLNGLGDSYLWLGGLYRVENKIDSGLWYARAASDVYRTSGVHEKLDSAYRLLSSLYHDKHLNDSAYAYLKMAAGITDSVDAADRKNLLGFQSKGFAERLKLEELQQEKIQTQTRIRTYALLGIVVIFMLIAFLLSVNNRNRKKSNEALKVKNEEIEYQKRNVESTLSELLSTQAQLIQSEKMASLGELTAGIAHEIQNPLNFVNNFSEVNQELAEELKSELAVGNSQLAIEIANDIKDNSEKISHHGKRADAIVKGMLQHSQSGKGVKEQTDINALCDEYLKLSYHGLRAKDKNFNADLKTDFDNTINKINIIPQDIARVLLNLINNAFYAVNEKKKMADENYHPTIYVETKKINNNIEIKISDNGNGIPSNIINKIFQPFFTTKPTGQGTGLGLSLSYDIIKAHNGEIKAETKQGEGTTFIIQLPVV